MTRHSDALAMSALRRKRDMRLVYSLPDCRQAAWPVPPERSLPTPAQVRLIWTRVR